MIADPSQFWKYSFALGSLDEAQEALESLSTLRSDQDAARRGLWLQFFISYARPFTQSKGIGMISIKTVPAEFKTIHDGLMNMRNYVFAHNDANQEMSEDMRMNQLVFVKTATGELQPSIRRPYPAHDQIPKLIGMIEAIAANVANKVAEQVNLMASEHSFLSPGTYTYDYEAEAGSRWTPA